MKFTRPLTFVAVVLVSSTAALPMREMHIRGDPAVIVGHAVTESGKLMERGIFSKIGGFAKGLFGFNKELEPTDGLHTRFIEDAEKLYERSFDEEHLYSRSIVEEELYTRGYADEGLVERGFFSKFAKFGKGIIGFRREAELEARSDSGKLVERCKIAGWAKSLVNDECKNTIKRVSAG
ncbi:hypothetical protein DXG01_012946 [Tephrocybe rancida]|nr:hypothetical protein DXG01_012946 [Tephrocybe rancida]